MANKSGKQKVTAFRPPAQMLSANLSNSAFGSLPASGSKGKSPAFSSRSVNVLPDLDLISGFAFLSFASLDQLEAHIEQNEAKFAAVSVNVGRKRKAEGPVEQHGSTSEKSGPPNKKKVATTKKKPVKNISSSSTNVLAAKPRESTPSSKDKRASVGTISDNRECNESAQSEISAGLFEILEQSPNTDSEISLLCSETVDLGDEEEIMEQEVPRIPVQVAGNTDFGDSGDGFAAASSTHVSEGVGLVDGGVSATDAKPKKKKKKKRKSEHCDQTSQTKFRLKKKKKPASRTQDLEGLSKVAVDELESDRFRDTTLQDVDNWLNKGGNMDDNKKAEPKASLSRPKFERVKCARTSIYQGSSKSGNFKGRFSGWGVSIGSSNNNVELTQAKNGDKCSLEGFTPNGSDHEIDVETRSNSVLSDFSDHSSDIELFDPHGCFLLNSKIDKVEKEEFQDGVEVVDVETVGKEARKNFLVVSGVEAGHFSYHPGITKEGTIDTSIQANPNEIDIFLQCAMMQEGQIIKIINPDDSQELHSHFTQKNGRDPNTVKATRSATERRRRHHLGDLFHDMKLEVFTGLYESDLYFSKQAILSKAITTLEELKQELSDLSSAKMQLLKQNKELKEKRNMLMFGKASVDVDSAKVEAILKHLNINVDDVECSDENAKQEQEDANVKQDNASESNVTVEPSVKGRPRVNKTLLPPWLLKPALKNKDNSSKSTANVSGKPGPQTGCETPKVVQVSTSLTHSSPALKTSNVSCGVQTQVVENGSSKPSGLENPTLPQTLLLVDNEEESVNESTRQEVLKPSLAESSPKVIHTVTSLSPSAPETKISNIQSGEQAQELKNVSSKPSGSETSSQSQVLLKESSTPKNKPVDQSSGQEGTKPSLVKILPKPAILHLNPSQQKAIMESLGQIKQPSSDKIICNLSRLSTQPNPTTPQRICIIRSGQLMKSLDSKNVMHLKITSDALKSCGSNTVTASTTSSLNQQVSDNTTEPSISSVGCAQTPQAPASLPQILPLAGVQNPNVQISTAQVFSGGSGQKPEMPTSTTQFFSVVGGQKPETPTSTAKIFPVTGGQKLQMPTSTAQILSVTGSQKPQLLIPKPQVPISAVQVPTSTAQILSVTGSQKPQLLIPKPQVPTSTAQFLTVAGGQKLQVPTSTAQMQQKNPGKTFLVSQLPLTSTSSPKFIFQGQQFNLIPSTSNSQGLPSTSQANADVTMRALASLNQLQANKPVPPLTETVTNPLLPTKKPVAGYLIGLKNVVMNVGSVGSKAQSTTPLQTLPLIAITSSFKATTTSQVSVTSATLSTLGKFTTSTVCSAVSASPIVSIASSTVPGVSVPSTLPVISLPSSTPPDMSVPSSMSLNTSFTMSTVNHPVPSTGITCDLDTVVPPIIAPCLDPFNLVPKQLATSTPAISTETRNPSSSLHVETEARKQAVASESTKSLPLLVPDDIFKPETSSSSTVLTQEMLKIPGIKQNPQVSSMLLEPPDISLGDVFPDLAEIDELTAETVNLPEPSSNRKVNSEGSDTCVSSSSVGSGSQTGSPSYSLRSSSADTSKLISPLKVTIKDFKKGKHKQFISTPTQACIKEWSLTSNVWNTTLEHQH